MLNRLIKILSCVLVIAIIISIAIAPIYTEAVATPIIIGGAALALGGLAWAISSAMGVSYNFSQASSNTLNSTFQPYYSVQTALQTSDFTFLKAIRTGYDGLKLSLAAYNALKAGPINAINDNNIADNSSGTIVSPANESGIALQQYIYTPNVSGNSGTLPDGTTYSIVSDGGVRNNVTLSNEYGTITTSFHIEYQRLYFYYDYSSYNWIYVFIGREGGYWNAQLVVDKSSATPATNISYTTGTIDETFADNASDNVTVVFPQTQLDPSASIDQIIQAINQLALNNDQNVTVEIDLQPQPEPTPIPIPTTPLGDVPYDEWYDTFGQSVFDAYNHLNLGQDALITVNQGMAEDVDDLVGLETDINETLQDGIVYGSRAADAAEDISTELTNVGTDVGDIADDVVVIVDEMGNVVDVLEGIEAQEYINGQNLGNIKTDTQAISTEITNVADDVDDLTDILPDVATLPDIKTATESLTDALPDIAVLPDIKTATETLTDTLPDIATLPDIKTSTETIEDTLTDTLPDIIIKIDDATTTITDEIPKLDDICENIDEAPLKDIDTGVTRLPNFLLPYITDLRGALGIWHYVTEWVGAINSTFSFILGVLTGTSIMTPIYASIAGYMCIRAYRRMCC